MEHHMDHRLLSQLEPCRVSPKIKVRVARLWDCANPLAYNELMSVDVLLLDEMGNSIEGTVRPEDGTYFEQLLQEGEVYFISNFIVAPNRETYRSVKNNFLLCFTNTTTAHHVESDTTNIPKNVFSFIPFDEVHSRIHDKSVFTDVIGHVISVGHLRETYVKERVIPKKNLRIHDLRNQQLLLKLWGGIAEDFPDEFTLEDNEPVVVIFTGLVAKGCQGDSCLRSSSATKLYLDQNIPEILPFKQR